MSIDADVQQLAALVADPAFKQRQQDFFTQHCMEFTDDEENKFSYTAMHKDYERLVEKELEDRLGANALERLTGGLEAFLQSDAAGDRKGRSPEVAEALDVLASFGDFPAFKAAMLARRAELQAAGPAEMRPLKGVLSIDECVERVRSLRQAADAADGWREIVRNPDLVAYTKECEGSSGTYCRITLTLPLPPRLCCDMFVNLSRESLAWRTNVRDLRLLRDLGPRDAVVEMELALPWAVRYVMSMPPAIICRCVHREDWPEPGDFAYVVVPYDVERGVALEELGPLGIKTGVISPDPQDPDKCVLTTMDLAKLGAVPSWGLGFLIRKMTASQLTSMVDAYKRSDRFKQQQSTATAGS